MPHILRSKLGLLKGDATTGSVAELTSAVDDADEYIHNVGQNAPAVEAKLEEIEAVVVAGEAAQDDLPKYFSDAKSALDSLMN